MKWLTLDYIKQHSRIDFTCEDAELELQKIHDKYIKKLDELIEAKNKEIMTV